MTLTPEQVSTWTVVIAERREAYRLMELEAIKAQAIVAAAKATVAIADDAVLRMVRSLGLDESVNWRLEGNSVTVAPTRDGG